MPLKEIEKTEVTCLVDNTVDILLQNTKVAYRSLLTENWFVNSLIAEHGFCAAIKIETNRTEHNILFDLGLYPISAGYNAQVLGLDLSFNEIVISALLHDY